MPRLTLAALLAGTALAAALPLAAPALAQPVDMTGGGPVEVTSTNGIEWRQNEQVVIATGNARAVRDGVTLQAARLIARYRNKAGGAAPAGQPASAQPAPAQPAADTGATPLSGGEIWRLEAEGNVHIDTDTDHAQGDRAVYDMDQAVMVLTGRNLKLTTTDDTIVARDSLEYWPQKRMAVARGAASAVTSDNRRIAGDTLVGYFLEQAATPQPPARPAAARPNQPPPRRVPGEGSKLDRVEVFGNVEIRTEQEVVRGDRGIYSPVTGTARLLGSVRITRGQNQLNGSEAIVDMRSGVARLVSAPGTRVQGLVVPGSNQPPAGNAAPANRNGAPAR
ncbi:LptA/OstA family protein [Roseomonas elaeocarpi]|uniref:LptA/OstA family protein n=1 Tax=Roseomonas elaeocarpi TaxID=907779 RepID=A0ABV6JUL9_9PROT